MQAHIHVTLHTHRSTGLFYARYFYRAFLARLVLATIAACGRFNDFVQAAATPYTHKRIQWIK